ncbi:Probable serine/threonine-protein kinase abkD [Linum perenne]
MGVRHFIFSCWSTFILRLIRYIGSKLHIFHKCWLKLLAPIGWFNIYRRRMRVFALSIWIYLDYKALQQREKWTSPNKRVDLWEKAHERNAKRLLNLMIQLEGLWVKFGQYLSTRADVLPRAYINLLKQLQDALPPRHMKEIRTTVQTELGHAPDDLFSYFDETPLATASIAQVHRATLKNGLEVVVKVQHEGIKTIILEDLKNAKAIIDWIAWAEPQYNFNPMIDEWCKEAPKELDFNHEADNTRAISKNLRCKNKDEDGKYSNNVDVLIPEVIQSTERVLILEYMDGIRLNDTIALEAAGVKKQMIVEEITRAYAHQIYVDGMFNGDPHPGNFLVSKHPPHRPILLDFGLTKKISTTFKQALAKMFLASVEGDHVALLSALSEMGLKLRLDMPDQAMEATSMFFRAAAPTVDPSANMRNLSEKRIKHMKVIQEKMNLNQKEVKRFNPLLYFQIDAFPGDIVIFGRVLNLLRGLSTTLNVRIIYQEIMRPFAESVLDGYINKVPSTNIKWIYDTPIHSNVEAKLRQLLVELGNEEVILGVQVCAYKDGKVIIDTAGGVLGKYDPRAVQLDSLFPVFSTTKGVTAGLVHWLVDNGIPLLDQNASRKKFQEILEEAIVKPLNIEGELYVGIPPGVESRLASLTVDEKDLKKLSQATANHPNLPSIFQRDSIGQLLSTIPALFNLLITRRAIIPAANGHCSARALARYYAALVDNGVIPPPHSSSSKPLLGSHPHIPKYGMQKPPKRKGKKCNKVAPDPLDKKPTKIDNNDDSNYDEVVDISSHSENRETRMYNHPRIHEAFLGIGDEYGQLAMPNGVFGLGFKRLRSKNGDIIGFGHSGIGGSTGFCYTKDRFAIAVTVNKMSSGYGTRKIMQLVCSELNLPLSEELESNTMMPLIN